MAAALTRGMSGETKPDAAAVINDAVDALTNLSVGDAAAGGDAGAAAGGSTAEGGGGSAAEDDASLPPGSLAACSRLALLVALACQHTTSHRCWLRRMARAPGGVMRQTMRGVAVRWRRGLRVWLVAV